MAEFVQIPITINTGIKRLIDPDNTPYFPLKNNRRPEFVAENKAILACTLIDSNKDPIVLGATDTFDGGGDINFIHVSASGTLSEILTATNVITSLEASVTDEADVPTAGNIRIFNAAGNWERIAYTAFDSATNIFTINSHTMLYTYAVSDVAKVEENLMFYFDDDDVDIAGDWDDIDRATGKISIRISCIADAFSEKLADSSTGRERIYIEIRRYAGSTTPSTLLLDYAYAQATVVDQNGEPGYTSAQYVTQAGGDTRWLRQALTTAYSAVTAVTSAMKFFVRDGSTSKYATIQQLINFITGDSAETSCPDDTPTNITLFDKTVYRKCNVDFTLDNGTNIIDYAYSVAYNDTDVTWSSRGAMEIKGSEISGVAITFDLSGDSVRLVVTLTAVGSAVKCVSKIQDKLILST